MDEEKHRRLYSVGSVLVRVTDDLWCASMAARECGQPNLAGQLDAARLLVAGASETFSKLAQEASKAAP